MSDLLRSAQHYLQTVDDLGPKITWTPEQDYEIEQSVRLIAALENLRDAVFEEDAQIEQKRLDYTRALDRKFGKSRSENHREEP